ncbi:MAG: hypothetical protein PVH19_09940, partial [Planctomycetia bacterium]
KAYRLFCQRQYICCAKKILAAASLPPHEGSPLVQENEKRDYIGWDSTGPFTDGLDTSYGRKR